MHEPPGVVGWREWVALPDLGVAAIKAKVDTGARSSALHAWDVEELDGEDGRRWVRFAVHPFQHDDEVIVRGAAPLVEHRPIRSSNGEVEVRPVVRLRIGLLGRRLPVEVGLTRRDEMGFRMLLGRRALRRRFLVDPGRSFVGGGTRVRPPS